MAVGGTRRGRNDSSRRTRPARPARATGWLGHENPVTTHQYVEADLAMKEAALRRVDDPAPQPLRFTATDRLLDFLEGL